MIQYGDADAAIAGGTESVITPLAVGGFAVMRALSTRNDEPERASRPWDRDRDGFVMGEGAGSRHPGGDGGREEARRPHLRGARRLRPLRRRVPHRRALRGRRRSGAGHEERAGRRGDRAGRGRATSTRTARRRPLGDRVETIAIKMVFGDARQASSPSPRRSPRPDTCSARPAGSRPGSWRWRSHQVLPPTINYETPDPECDLDYVPNVAREKRVEYALSNSFGFGGTNGCLVLKAV